MTRLLIALLCLLLLNGCGSGTSGQSSTSQTRLLANANAPAADYAAVVQQLYVSYFGRPADAAGLAFYEGILAAAGAPTTLPALNVAYSTNATVKTVIDGFGTSAESNALYGDDTGVLVNAVYRNLFNRDAESAGLAFWTDLINKGTYTKSQAALIIMSAAQGSDMTAVTNKVSVATSFTGALTTSVQLAAYSGLGPNATVRGMLATVSDTTDLAAFQASVLSTIGSIAATAHTTSATVSTFAGSGNKGSANGKGTAASFHFPLGVAVDANGYVYVADESLNLIRKITPEGVVSTLAGNGTKATTNGTGTGASFYTPRGLAVDGAGNIYVAELNGHTIRKITPAGVVTTFAGSGTPGNANGTGTAASFDTPAGLALDSAGNLYVADGKNHLIRKITPAGVVTTFAGSGSPGSTNGTGTAASFYYPGSVAVDSAGNLYVADAGNSLIRKITPAGVVTTLAGSGAMGSANGTGTEASFNNIQAVAVDSSGNVYVADADNFLIRKITAEGVVTTLAGTGVSGNTNGTGALASFRSPYGVAVDLMGNVYVADTNNEVIRKITQQ